MDRKSAGLVFAAAVVALGCGGVVMVRSAVGSFYESETFKQELRAAIEGALAEAGVEALVIVPAVRARGWFDFDVPDVMLKPADGQEHKMKIGVDIGLIPEALRGRAAVAVDVSTADVGRVTANAEVSLTKLRKLQSGGLSAIRALTGKIERLSAPLVARLLRGQGGDRRVWFAAGLLDGTFALENPGEQPLIKSRLRLRGARWMVTMGGTKMLASDDMDLAVVWRPSELALEKPVTWAGAGGRAQIEGRLLLPGEAGPAYDLKVRSSGPVQRAALMSLFRCRGKPASDAFAVTGPVKEARCG